MVATCCVPGCKNRHSKESSLDFCRVPKDPEIRQLWIRAIFKDGDTMKNYDRICGAHFITGMRSTDPSHPDYVPSIFPSTTVEEFKELQQKYEAFRNEQEKSLMKLSTELTALNHLWMEKGWSQDSVKKLLNDGHPASFHALNQPSSSTTQATPAVEKDQYLILDKGSGMGRMVVKLSHPVKYVTTEGLVETRNPLAKGPQDSSYGWYGYGEGFTESAFHTVPKHGSRKRNRGVQFDAYIDIDNEIEEKDNITKSNVDENEQIKKNQTPACLKFTEDLPSVGRDSLSLLQRVNQGKATNDLTEECMSVDQQTAEDMATNDQGNNTCIPMECDAMADETGMEQTSDSVSGKYSRETSESEILSVGNKDTNLKEDADVPKPLSWRSDMKCDTVTDKDKASETKNKVKTNKKPSGQDHVSLSEAALDQTELNERKGTGTSPEKFVDFICDADKTEEMERQENVSSSLESSRSSEKVTESFESNKKGEELKQLPKAISDKKGSFEVMLEDKENTECASCLPVFPQAENEKNVVMSDSTFVLDHPYHQDKNNKAIEIKLSKAYVPSTAAFLRCHDQHVEHKLGCFKYIQVVVIDEKKLTCQKENTDSAVQTDQSDVFRTQVNMETQRLTLMEEMLWYHDRINKRSYSLHAFENNREKVQFYTGCANFETLKALFDYLIPHISPIREQLLSHFEQFAITLMKLRLGLRMKDLGYQVNLSNARLSQLVTHWFDGMYCCLAPLVDWPTGKKLTLSFFQNKIQDLKRRYFILENSYDNLKTSDNWMLVKGVRDTVRVCDALSKFYVPGTDDDPETNFADVKDPFEVPEPVTEDEESSSSSEESSAEERERETDEEEHEEIEVLSKKATGDNESFSEDNQEIQRMLDANISVKDINIDTPLISGSLLDTGLSDMSLVTNAFSNYPGIDCGLSGSYSSMDSALIRHLGLDTVSTSNRSGDSVFSNQPALSNMENLFGMSMCGDSTVDPVDSSHNTYAEQSDVCVSAPVNVNTLHETISLLANRLKSDKKNDKKEIKRVGRRSYTKSSSRKTTLESHEEITTVARALGDHSYIRNDVQSQGSKELLTSAFSQFSETVKNDHSYCLRSSQGGGVNTESSSDIGMMDDTDELDYGSQGPSLVVYVST